MPIGESFKTLDHHAIGSADRLRLGVVPPPQIQDGQVEESASGSVDANTLGDADFNDHWPTSVAKTLQYARHQGQLSASLERALDADFQPVLPWEALLERFLMNCSRNDYSFFRINRRESDALMPSLRNQETQLVIALDASGSITPNELAEFIAEINALKLQVNANVCLLACDVG